MSTVLALREVRKRYGARRPWVLSGAELSLEQGSLTSIVGPNGSGKSTLLRIAAGVTSPTTGTAAVPARVGYVPERQAARCKLSGTEYLGHMGRIRGLATREAKRAGADLLVRLGVRPGPDVPWQSLSKGNRQKVVVAQAFLGQLDAIVLDEPFGGLDDEARFALDELIDEARARGTSVLLSSHEVPMGIAQTYRLVDGRLEASADVPSEPALGASFRRVKLSRREGRHPPDALTHRSGVARWHATPEGTALQIDVLADSCDALLRAALDLGWSVRSVLPIAPGGED